MFYICWYKYYKSEYIMKYFIKIMLIETFEEGEYFLGILMWLLFLIFFVLIIWLFAWLIDSSYLPIKEDIGVITDKYIIPSHHSTTYIKSGELLVPITNYYDESYHITIQINEMCDDVSICESSYNSIEVGQKLNCKYTNGRLFKTLYIQSFTYYK